LLSAVKASNDAHRTWVLRKLQAIVGDLKGQCIAVLGLTYKPGTDTLRRSGSVELCTALAELGARVQAHDPAVKKLPDDLAQKFTRCETPESTLPGAAALVVATEWPEYRSLTADAVVQAMGAPVVVDPNRFLFETMGDPRIRYFSVGSPSTRKGASKN
jgi:UDPglucose 6-dehydrogenase